MIVKNTYNGIKTVLDIQWRLVVHALTGRGRRRMLRKVNNNDNGVILGREIRMQGENNQPSLDDVLRLVSEISELTRIVQKTQGLEEGKVEEIERGLDKIFKDYSNMNPRRPNRFLRDLAEIANLIDSTYNQGLLSLKQKKILEITLKKTKMRDFYSARRFLMKFGKPIEIKRERDNKLEQYRSFRRKLENQSKQLKSRIADFKSVPRPEKSLDEIQEVKQTLKKYNELVTSTVINYYAHAPCRDALSITLKAIEIPEFSIPPPRNRESLMDLMRVLEEQQVKNAFGDENISKLVEVANFTDKRLEHFVKDYKWFQRRLQENLLWLSELSGNVSDTLSVKWPEPSDRINGKIIAFKQFLKLIPQMTLPSQPLVVLEKLVVDGQYEISRQSEKLYSLHEEAAEAKFNGTLDKKIEENMKALSKIQDTLARLPEPEDLRAKSNV